MRTKKLWSRVISILLVIALLPVSALAEHTADPKVVTQPDFTVTVSHVNPEYERLGVKFTKPSADCMTMAETTVDSLDEAADYLREQMEDRVTEVTIVVQNHTYVSNQGLSDDWRTILYGAFEHTGVSTQGDYIIRHYGQANGQIGHNGISTATFKYTITYDTTLEQENEVGDKIDELFTAWDEVYNFYDLSDYEQIEMIYDYICANVVYDYDNLNDNSYTLKYSAYAALIQGTAVCQGYANLFYRMALEAGVDNRIIVGDAGGAHAWNIVDMGEKYYYLDSTWDAPRFDYGYEYFLLGSDNFHVDHTPDAEFWSEEFLAEYPIDAKDYNQDMELIMDALLVRLLVYIDSINMDSSLTRLDMAKLIAAMVKLELDSDAVLPYEDCAALTDQEKQIIAAVEKFGVMTAYKDGTFRPAETIDRARLALLLYRTMNGNVDAEDIGDYADDGYFTDVGSYLWYAPYVNYLASIGVIPAWADKTFDPDDTADLRTALRWMVKAANYEKPGDPTEILASGYCGAEDDGTNLTWTLTEDGTLTISGEGEMADYSWTDQPWYEYRNQITAVVVGSGVTSIGAAAFANYYTLTTVEIPNGVTSIGGSAFFACGRLEDVALPESLTVIERQAFAYCTRLTEIFIPADVTSIGSRAFVCCTALPAITVDADNAYYCSVDGVLFSKDKTTLIAYPSGKAGAVYRIPDGVTTLERCSFEVRGGDLVEVVIPAGVTELYYAFERAETVTTITVDIDNEYYCSLDGVLFSKDMAELLNYPIGREQTVYDVPVDVTTIGENAFLDCYLLEQITLPEGLLWMENGAFSLCSGLKEIVIPDDVTVIPYSAFRGCSALTSITIPVGVTEIEGMAFSDCSALTTVYYTGTEEQWNAVAIEEDNDPLLNAEVIYEWNNGDGEHTHVYDESVWKNDETNHWHECTCGEKSGLAAHELEEVARWQDCKEPGGVIWHCTVCGYEYMEELPQLEHTPVTISGYPATCTEPGMTDGVECEVCGTVIEWPEEIPAKGHTDENGDGVCDECGEGEHTHVYDESVWKNDETNHWHECTCGEKSGLAAHELEEVARWQNCMEPGGVIWHCTVCGYEYMEELPQLEHTPVTVSGYPATCTEPGMTDGVECEVCGTVIEWPEEIPAKGHTDENGDGVCDECGDGEHTHVYDESVWKNDETNHWHECTCGEKSGLAAHELEEVARWQNCMEPGGVIWHCTVCGYEYMEELPQLEHTPVTISGYPATCTEPGMTDGVECEVCGTVIEWPEEIPALGHEYDEGVVTTEPTCTENGVLTYTCQREGCGHSYTEVIEAKGHTEEVIPGKEPTLTEPGLTEGKKCTDCGEIIVAQEEIPVLEFIEGTCGETLTWKLTKDGVLTISGEGAMYSFTFTADLVPTSVLPMGGEKSETAPWNEYNGLIIKVIIEDGVTGIGDNAFAACENLKEIEIPETVTSIGDGAFTGCEALETVTYTGSEEQWAEIEIGAGNEVMEDIEITIADIIPGDVNGDGSVNIFDAIELLDLIADGSADVLSSGEFRAADVNGDSSVNIFDAIELLDLIASGAV